MASPTAAPEPRACQPRYNRDPLPLNPRFEGTIEDKVAVLEDPELSSDIVRGRYAER